MALCNTPRGLFLPSKVHAFSIIFRGIYVMLPSERGMGLEPHRDIGKQIAGDDVYGMLMRNIKRFSRVGGDDLRAINNHDRVELVSPRKRGDTRQKELDALCAMHSLRDFNCQTRDLRPFLFSTREKNITMS